MVEKYMGPARPFERAKLDAANGSAPACGDLRHSCEETMQHLSGQVQRSSKAAGSCNDFGGSAGVSGPFDVGDSVEGSDEALVALL